MPIGPAGKALLHILTELYYVSRRIDAKSLFASRTFHDIVFKLHTVPLKSGNLGFNIVNGNHDSIPSSW